MKVSHSLHFLAIVVFFCLVLTIITPGPQSPTSHDLSPAATANASVPDAITALQQTELHGELQQGDTFSTSMKRLLLPDQVVTQVLTNMKGCLDYRRLRPGDRYSVVYDENNNLIRCNYESGPLDVYALERTSSGFVAEKLAVPVECHTERITGRIDKSLFASFSSYQVDSSLIYSFADIFASRIDFNTETRKGDRFSLLFEKYYKAGMFIGYGRILMARYERSNTGEVLEGFRYGDDNGVGGSYYDRSGEDLGSAFIRSPVPVGRISSKFTLRRKHPILGVVRPHLGVDLAAPIGTPIMAAADGKVLFVGRKGGFGKQVILKHSNGYSTYYGHLSRFKPGMKRGRLVKQKEIIGYVGSTGMSTGPHLDYRLAQNNIFMNPFSMKFKPKSRISKSELTAYREQINNLAGLLDLATDKRVLQVRQLLVQPDQRIALL
ncbi:MAG: peptidoglycan DD-metalloendopeptidase family protein [Desulfobulbaceae bacterium]|nr:peptidoglycan DD-metalloendopeptidase family protein [Desulfobulbaceae bacterium]